MPDRSRALFAPLAALSGLVAVATGAFGAHALKTVLSPEYAPVWQTAVHYQMFHTLALLILAVLPVAAGGLRLARVAGWLFVAGMVVFSGSLYVLALTGVRMLGAVTPIGGLCLLAAWGCWAVALMKRQ